MGEYVVNGVIYIVTHEANGHNLKAAKSPKLLRLVKGKNRKNEALRMLVKRIFMNVFRTLQFSHKQCVKFLASPFRM